MVILSFIPENLKYPMDLSAWINVSSFNPLAHSTVHVASEMLSSALTTESIPSNSNSRAAPGILEGAMLCE